MQTLATWGTVYNSVSKYMYIFHNLASPLYLIQCVSTACSCCHQRPYLVMVSRQHWPLVSWQPQHRPARQHLCYLSTSQAPPSFWLLPSTPIRILPCLSTGNVLCYVMSWDILLIDSCQSHDMQWVVFSIWHVLSWVEIQSVVVLYHYLYYTLYVFLAKHGWLENLLFVFGRRWQTPISLSTDFPHRFNPN